MYTCYRCGGAITFFRRAEDDEIIPRHLDGSCSTGAARYVAVPISQVIPFDGALADTELVGVALNVAARRVHLADPGAVVSGLQGILACDLRVTDGRAIRVYLSGHKRPDVRTLIRAWPREVALRGDIGPSERALYSARFDVVEVLREDGVDRGDPRRRVGVPPRHSGRAHPEGSTGPKGVDSAPLSGKKGKR